MCYNIRRGELPTNYWELNAPKSQRDLMIKKLAIAIIAALNLAVLAGALYFIITYCPMPTEALLVSPFIVGILGALAYLKFPTCGINSLNYSQYSNPATIAGKTLTYIFFGPYMYAAKKCDWTVYHDPRVANKIAKDLETKSFEYLAKEYGKHFANFAEYGMIHPEFKQELLNLYHNYKPIKKALKYYESKGLEWHSRVETLTVRKNGIESRWEVLREKIMLRLVFPEIPEPDFSSPVTGYSIKLEEFFNNPPFEKTRKNSSRPSSED
jgi:hypothetical protein